MASLARIVDAGPGHRPWIVAGLCENAAMKIALVTAIPALLLDEDLPPLEAALRRIGVETQVLAWDDPTVSWARFDAVLLRSPWDYVERLPEFLAWCEHVSGLSRLLNPLSVVRANTDKHYLAELEKAGVPVVPSRFIEPGEDAAMRIAAFLDEYASAAEFVVKPAVGAGSRDAQRHGREQRDVAIAHAKRLLAAGRSVLLQPYLPSVDQAGETALVHFDGVYSHAIRKGPLLQRDQGPTEKLFAPEAITAREPGADERAVAEAALKALGGLFQLDRPLAYARVDLIRDADGAPRLLELELTEPSLFFGHAEGSAERFASALAQRLAA